MPASVANPSDTASGLVENVEAKRKTLEANIAKLEAGLEHWRTWEIEYGDLVEQVESGPEQPSPKDLLAIASSLNPKFITKEELGQIVGPKEGTTRSRQQVVNVVNRRIDYVQQNIQTLQKQLDAKQMELEQLIRLNSDVEIPQDDQPLEFMEITEELDEDGNVVSSSVASANDAASGIASFLKTAGIDAEATKGEMKPEKDTSVKPGITESQIQGSTVPALDGSSQNPPAPLTPASSSKSRKSVSFAADISVSPPPAQRPASPMLSALPPTPMKTNFDRGWEVREAEAGRFFEGDRVIELNDEDEEIGSLPVVAPPDDSPEAARLRREMERYAMGEVGAVVAEMNLEEGSNSDDYYYDSDDDHDGENEYGMATAGLMSDADRATLKELEEKLGARYLRNIGPESNATDEDGSEAISAKPRKKGVRFSSDVDIASTVSSREQAEKTNGAKPFGDRVVERPVGTSATASTRSAPAQSDIQAAGARLQVEGNNNPDFPPLPLHSQEESGVVSSEAPEGPPGRVHADEVIERTVNSKPLLPDRTGLDPIVLQQEVAKENRRMIDRKVHREGGYKPSLEDEENPLVEEKNGQVKRVSRFKAARLKEAGL